MQFVGDFISKIEADRGESVERPLKIKTDVNILDVIQKDFYAAGDKKEGVSVEYKFDVAYGENSGKILVTGGLFAYGDKKEMKEIVALWKEDKQKATEKLLPFLNKAMEMGYLAAIPVAKEMRLPTPLKLPRFIAENKEEEAKKDYVG